MVNYPNLSKRFKCLSVSQATHCLPGDDDDDGRGEWDGGECLVLDRVDHEEDEEGGREEGEGEEGVVHQEGEGEGPRAGRGSVHCMEYVLELPHHTLVPSDHASTR